MAKNRVTSAFSPAANDDIYLYTKGGEYSLDGVEYVGEYHKVMGVAKTGPKPGPGTQVLQRLYTNRDHYIYDKIHNFDVAVMDFVEPKPHLFNPTDVSYESGFEMRFFVEKVEDDFSYAVEIDNDQFNLINKPGGIDGGVYLSAAVRWKLTGRRQDIIDHNEMELYKASSKVPSVNYAVKNFLEFARITLV